MLSLVALAVGLAVAAMAIVALALAAQLRSSHRLRILLGKYVRGQSSERPPLFELAGGPTEQRQLRTASGKTPRFIIRIDEQLAAAGLLITARQWLVLVLLAAVSIGLLSGVVLQSMVAGFLLAVGIAIAGLRSYLPAQLRRRQERFANALPQALQAIAASLRSGQTLVSAIDGVAQLQRDEVAFQFQRALAEAQFGATIEEALARVAERMKSEDLRWLVLTLQIHREIGGPLNEVVDAVAQTMATRAELRREVRVLATEGKLSAMVLVAVPFIAFAALFVLRREYLSFFWTQPLGFAMLGGFAALMLAGWLWLQSILKEE
jgi:tight adherence protein B